MGIMKLINKPLYKSTLKAKREATTKYELTPVITGRTLEDLTNEEIQAIEATRGVLGTKATLDYWRFYKTYAGFNPNYIADDDFIPFIIRSLNPTAYYKAHQNKSMYPISYAILNMPQTYVNCINGVIYDCDQNPMTEEKAVELLKGHEDFIIKPTKGTCAGTNVQKIVTAQCNDIPAVLNAYNGYYICQEVVKQSASTAKFSPSSLNTFRVSTVNLNGRCTAESIIFRHGRDGNICDNGMAGGIMVGVDKTGKFKPFGYDKHMNKYEKSPTGISYGDTTVEYLPELIKYIEDAHRKLIPDMGFAGWDFALDENNKPVFIEVNLGYPGIMFEQLTTQSPIFADRTKEVYDFVAVAKKELDWKNDFCGTYL